MLGGFAHGDIATVSKAFANHLVKDAMVAQYVEPAKPDTERKPRTVKKNGAA